MSIWQPQNGPSPRFRLGGGGRRAAGGGRRAVGRWSWFITKGYNNVAGLDPELATGQDVSDQLLTL
jgi:hypothetical protein